MRCGRTRPARPRPASVPDPDFILPDWPVPPSVRAAFSLRTGGASGGPFASLNLGGHVGDDPAAVAGNRARVAGALGLPAEPLWLTQVHGCEVARFGDHRPGPADASVALGRAQVCAVLVADCLPVLLADRGGTCVAAAHAGWRGLAAGVLERTVASLPVEPSDLVAWLGPAIGPGAFEVGDEVRKEFLAADEAAAGLFRPSPAGRWLADIFGLARLRLAAAGVASVHGGGLCTVSDPGRFFSYRRDGMTGRLAALVWRE
jgi:YfiH family protein